jgi:hypothetical protein
MLGEFSGHTRHVGRLPRKDIFVGAEELDERAFLFVDEAGSYQDGLLRDVAVQGHLLLLACRLESRVECGLLRLWQKILKAEVVRHSPLCGC